MSYECHVTIATPFNKEDLKKIVENFPSSPMWKFSCITDDPILGPGKYAYATLNYDPYEPILNHEFFVIQKSLDLTKVLLQNGYEILRVKVEQTVFDHRFKYAKQSVQDTQNKQQS